MGATTSHTAETISVTLSEPAADPDATAQAGCGQKFPGRSRFLSCSPVGGWSLSRHPALEHLANLWWVNTPHRLGGIPGRLLNQLPAMGCRPEQEKAGKRCSTRAEVSLQSRSMLSRFHHKRRPPAGFRATIIGGGGRGTERAVPSHSSSHPSVSEVGFHSMGKSTAPSHTLCTPLP